MASTTAKGPYANSVYVLIHYAFGGVKASITFVFGLTTSTSGSNTRVPPPRGSLLAARPWATPSGSSGCSPLTWRHLMPRFAACGPAFGWVRSPFFIVYFFLLLFAYPRGGFLPGRPDVFPGRGQVLLHNLFWICPSCLLDLSGFLHVPEQPDVFSRLR